MRVKRFYYEGGKVARTKSFTEAEIIRALKKYRGLVCPAAKSIGITPQCLYRRARAADGQAIRDEIKWQRVEIVDQAQSKLLKMLDDENNAHHWKATEMILRTWGAKRGFIEIQKVRMGGDKSAPPIKTQQLDIAVLPLELRKQLLDFIRKREEPKEN